MSAANVTIMAAPAARGADPAAAPAPSPERSAPLPALTGLRFFAAGWVVLFHATTAWRPGLISLPVLAPVIGAGQVAVTFFFVLSGFVLGHSYLSADGRFRGTLGAYYVARVARLSPVYLLALALALVPFLAWGSDLAGPCPTPVSRPLVALATLALAQMWLPGHAYCLNPPAWSLSVEALFYALVPLAALAIGRLPARALLLALAALFVAAALCGFAGLSAPPAFLPAFGVGMCVARLHRLTGAGGLVRARRACAALGLAGAGLGAGLVPLPFLPLSCCLLPCFALALYGLAEGGGVPCRLLGAAALVRLGQASYALYILSWPCMEICAHLAGRPFGLAAAGDPGAWPLVAAQAALTIALALCVQHYVEEPARRAICRRWARQPRALSPGPAPARLKRGPTAWRPFR